jgi:hypothetical protein
MESTKSLDESYFSLSSTPELGTHTDDIFVYEGSEASPRWFKDPEGFGLLPTHSSPRN